MTQSAEQQHAAFCEDANDWLARGPAIPRTVSALLYDLSAFEASDDVQAKAVARFLDGCDCDQLPASLKRSIRRWENWPVLEGLLDEKSTELAS